MEIDFVRSSISLYCIILYLKISVNRKVNLIAYKPKYNTTS